MRIPVRIPFSYSIFSNLSRGGEPFKDAFAQALALKLNLTTTQRANEKALKDITKSSGATADLKQALQARAALYGELLEPSYFAKNSDLSLKANSLFSGNSLWKFVC